MSITVIGTGKIMQRHIISYEHTQHICITINSARLQPDGSVNVEVTDNAVEDNAQKSGTVTRVYHGHFQAKLEQSSWKLIPYFGHGNENGVCKY